MNLKLNGKSTLVTASSAGIGFEIAKALAAEGADVILTGRVQEKLDQAAAEIETATGRAVHLSGQCLHRPPVCAIRVVACCLRGHG